MRHSGTSDGETRHGTMDCAELQYQFMLKKKSPPNGLWHALQHNSLSIVLHRSIVDTLLRQVLVKHHQLSATLVQPHDMCSLCGLHQQKTSSHSTRPTQEKTARLCDVPITKSEYTTQVKWIF